MRGRVVVFIEGGVMQGIISDTPGLEYLLVDYDNLEEYDENDNTVEEKREFFDIEYNPEAVDKAEAGTEND